MAGDFTAIPDWFSWQNQDCGVAVGDVTGDGQPDVVVLLVDNPAEQNGGFYRIGHGLGVDGAVGMWDEWIAIPDWFGWENHGAGLALADLSGNGQLDLVVMVVDNPQDQNGGYFRIGRDLAPNGVVTGGWTPWIAIPDWFGWENNGADIAVTTVNGVAALVVVTADNPPGQNSGQFRMALGLKADGSVDHWSPWVAVPDWWGWDNQGVGLTAADLDGDGRPELIVFTIDNPAGANVGLYTVGWGLDGTGHCVDGWSGWQPVPGWKFADNQGAGIALLPGAGRPELVVMTIQEAPEQNAAYLRTVDMALDVDEAHHMGVWRLLDFDTEINPVHAALLRTGDVLFFAGSGNDEVQHAIHQFRTRVWHYPSSTFSIPDTPIDLFCVGHSFLADGRLLAAGGTERYDPFYGLKDALVFDPDAMTWNVLPHMAFGRWYPTLVTVGDGTAVAMSGLGADNNLSVVPERFDPATNTWTALPSPGPIPMYAHLYLLNDGRLFYAGAQYGANNGQRPQLWDLATGFTQQVAGLAEPGSRNQSASVLLPPAQDQKVMVFGGGGFDMHSPAPALADTRIVDLTAAQPVYQPGPPLEHARMHCCAVILPDSTVLVTGGSGMEEMAHAAPAHSEIYHPDTNTWTHTAVTRVPRLYHSVALLTPDGKVITAGSNPLRRTEDRRIEVYWPAYLFHGPRPTITLESARAAHGGEVTATVGGGVVSYAMLRPGASTHSCDPEQRLIDLEFTRAAGQVRLHIPANPNLAPPGWYLVVARDHHGVPSEGQWLQIG